MANSIFTWLFSLLGPDFEVWFEPDPVLLISGLMANGSLTMKAGKYLVIS
jgi:hypothetical protein